jgi:hypothetical protein
MDAGDPLEADVNGEMTAVARAFCELAMVTYSPIEYFPRLFPSPTAEVGSFSGRRSQAEKEIYP